MCLHELPQVSVDRLKLSSTLPQRFGKVDAFVFSDLGDRVKSLALDAALYGDSARSFVDLCLRPSSDSSAIVPHSQLHTWYVSYCQQHGYTPLGQSKFISHLRTILSRNHVDRGWSPMVNGERSRLPAHWQGINPVLGVFVSSGEGEMQFSQNPQWICLKAKCVEGGLEEFEDYWNSPSDLPKPLEPLYSAGVQGVQPQNSENQGVDSLKPLYSAGVQGGSTVQGKSFEVDSKLNDASLQAENSSLRVKTLGGQNGQGGQVDVEPVSADSANVDRLDRLDNFTLLPQDAVQQAVERMAAIDSVESFQQFYDLHQRCSQIQQQQVMDAFTTQVDDEQQIRFYQCWQQFEAPELMVEPELTQASAQESVKSAGRNQWVYARLSQSGGETLVRVLSEKFDSITVHVPGSGSKSIKPSEVIRVSPYTGD